MKPPRLPAPPPRPHPEPGPEPPQTFPISAPPKAQCNGRYPGGQCTAGAAVMFPSVCQAPNLGNGGEWYGNAARLGWPHKVGEAVPGWLASFSVYAPYGDVGLITALNPDGTVQRYGTNWHLDGKWSSDKVPAERVIGSFQPPGAFFGPKSQDKAPSPATGARGLPCRYGWSTPKIDLVAGQSIGAQSICFDGLVGAVAWVLGVGTLVAALLIAVRGPAARMAGRATEVAGVATGQPEVVAAGRAVRQQQGERQSRPRARSLGRQGPPQEQETYRDLRQAGYSPVESRRMAQSAGAQGEREERLRRALLSAQG